MKELLMEARRICKKSPNCSTCPLYAPLDGCTFAINFFDEGSVDEIAAKMEKWEKENPRVTRQDKLKEVLPHMLTDEYGVCEICPASANRHFECPISEGLTCVECRKEYRGNECEES